MHYVDNFTGIPLSKFTNGARLLIGGCLIALAPILSIPMWNG